MKADGRRDDDQDGRDGNQNGERFGEVLSAFHLGDEGWEEDLRDPEEGDVQNGVHAGDPACAWEGEGICFDLAVGGVVAIVAVERSFFLSLRR